MPRIGSRGARAMGAKRDELLAALMAAHSPQGIGMDDDVNTTGNDGSSHQDLLRRLIPAAAPPSLSWFSHRRIS
jgi:hypothetical protein